VVEKVGEIHRPWASNGKLYHLWLWIECTLFRIFTMFSPEQDLIRNICSRRLTHINYTI
jgi:hypothetical protein